MTIVNSELWMNIMTNDFVHTGFHKHKQLPHNTARASELLFFDTAAQAASARNPKSHPTRSALDIYHYHCGSKSFSWAVTKNAPSWIKYIYINIKYYMAIVAFFILSCWTG